MQKMALIQLAGCKLTPRIKIRCQLFYRTFPEAEFDPVITNTWHTFIRHSWNELLFRMTGACTCRHACKAKKQHTIQDHYHFPWHNANTFMLENSIPLWIENEQMTWTHARPMATSWYMNILIMPRRGSGESLRRDACIRERKRPTHAILTLTSHEMQPNHLWPHKHVATMQYVLWTSIPKPNTAADTQQSCVTHKWNTNDKKTSSEHRRHLRMDRPSWKHIWWRLRNTRATHTHAHVFQQCRPLHEIASEGTPWTTIMQTLTGAWATVACHMRPPTHPCTRGQ